MLVGFNVHRIVDDDGFVHAYLHHARRTLCGLNKATMQRNGGEVLWDTHPDKVDCWECADLLLGSLARAGAAHIDQGLLNVR